MTKKIKEAKEAVKTSKEIYEEYVKSLEGKTKEELEAMEKELIEKMEANDQDVSKVLFDMPEENYAEAAEAIRYFLNKNKVQWQYTLGLVTLYEFWQAEKPTKINYPTLDATLRNLGGMEFSGYDEWKKVCMMNEYFAPLREGYVKFTEKTYLLAEEHNAIMDAMKIHNPVQTTPGEE